MRGATCPNHRTCSPKVQTSLDSVNHTVPVPLRNWDKPARGANKRRVRWGDAGILLFRPNCSVYLKLL